MSSRMEPRSKSRSRQRGTLHGIRVVGQVNAVSPSPRSNPLDVCSSLPSTNNVSLDVADFRVDGLDVHGFVANLGHQTRLQFARLATGGGNKNETLTCWPKRARVFRQLAFEIVDFFYFTFAVECGLIRTSWTACIFPSM